MMLKRGPMMCLSWLQRPLALAKILGAYSIGFKNSKTGSSKRMDVVVMENLLYGRTFSSVRSSRPHS